MRDCDMRVERIVVATRIQRSADPLGDPLAGRSLAYVFYRTHGDAAFVHLHGDVIVMTGVIAAKTERVIRRQVRVESGEGGVQVIPVDDGLPPVSSARS